MELITKGAGISIFGAAVALVLTPEMVGSDIIGSIASLFGGAAMIVGGCLIILSLLK